MSDGQEESLREPLSFAQAEGASPLPEQLKLKQVSLGLKSYLWRFILESMKGDVDSFGRGYDPLRVEGSWCDILYDWHSLECHKPADEFSNYFDELRPYVKSLIYADDYVTVLGFVEYIVRHPECPADFDRVIAAILERNLAAYRLVNRTIVPITSEANAISISQSLETLKETEFGGATAHLEFAAARLSKGDYADSIRESIHAVESVAKMLAPEANTLDPALKKLEKAGVVHPALKQGFANLYGYTSDEKGVRHALMDKGGADVSETDALYMFGSCAAFVSYLVHKSVELSGKE
jgi:uncharacterized glyoxalase superfamily protein PhnB